MYQREPDPGGNKRNGMGFFCDLDGSDEIHLDEEELSQAGWYDRQKLPIRDDGISLTREMIRVFQERREPK